MLDLDSHLSAIVAGDTAAFGRWMASSEHTVRDSLRSFAARVDTESVVQETFLRVWQVAPRFQRDGRPNGLLRLALRIARNLAISETRRLKTAATVSDELENRVAVELDERGPRPPDPMLRQAIVQCRQRLPDKPGQALTARLESAGGDHDREVARRIGMTRNTFLQNVTRARRFLVKCLEELGVNVNAEIV